MNSCCLQSRAEVLSVVTTVLDRDHWKIKSEVTQTESVGVTTEFPLSQLQQHISYI